MNKETLGAGNGFINRMNALEHLKELLTKHNSKLAQQYASIIPRLDADDPIIATLDNDIDSAIRNALGAINIEIAKVQKSFDEL